MTSFSPVEPEIDYPDHDGNPMSDNTKQFRWIVTIKENLEILFAAFFEVFIAGDLLWYPIENDNVTRQAPDVMVVFGRPKGDRGSYQQWKEGNIAPQVAFEILSPRNTKAEMARKRKFYETHGIEEYYQYDPDRRKLEGWIRRGGRLRPIASMYNWVSPRLGIRFVPPQATQELQLYYPDGRRFLTSVELAQLTEQAEQLAEQAQQQAESERQRAESERQRAESERQRAESERQRANQAETQLKGVIQSLARSGLDPTQISAMTGVAIDQVQQWVSEFEAE